MARNTNTVILIGHLGGETISSKRLKNLRNRKASAGKLARPKRQ